jgi:hypothetical protein
VARDPRPEEVDVAQRILLVQRGEGHDAATWARAVAAGLDSASVGPWALDVVETDGVLRSALGLPPTDVAHHGIVWTADAGAGDDPVPAWWSVVAGVAELSAAFVTTPHHAWGSFEAGPGVAQISLLRAAEGYDLDTFRASYRAHVELAREHMPSVVRYVQHDVDAVHGDGADGVLAISELRFASTDDFVDRYWATPESPETFRAHEPWLSRKGTLSLFATERITSR